MVHFLLFMLIAFPVQSENVVEWLTPTTHDFGDIKQGVPAKATFRFTNTGMEAMTIDNVRLSCGCTASEWEEEIIQPGEESTIKVEYSAKTLGYFNKKITVFFSNQRKGIKLYIEGYVE